MTPREQYIQDCKEIIKETKGLVAVQYVLKDNKRVGVLLAIHHKREQVGNVVFFGMSKCNPRDKWNKYIGIAKAIQNPVTNPRFDYGFQEHSKIFPKFIDRVLRKIKINDQQWKQNVLKTVPQTHIYTFSDVPLSDLQITIIHKIINNIYPKYSFDLSKDGNLVILGYLDKKKLAQMQHECRMINYALLSR